MEEYTIYLNMLEEATEELNSINISDKLRIIMYTLLSNEKKNVVLQMINGGVMNENN